ncbi:serine/threonine-protein kinase [Actinokineospora sp. 24-640]
MRWQNRYRVTGRLGAGPMGEVVGAVRGDGVPARVAVKLLRGDLAACPETPGRLRELVGEVHGVGGEHLVAVWDSFRDGDVVGLVMDLAPGASLRGRLAAGGPLPPAGVAGTGARIAAALAVLHRRRFAHLAVKPENVLVDGDSVRLTGHCLVPLLLAAQGRAAVLLNTPQYTAPEIPLDGPVSPAADLYSLGVILYELCCGVPPLAGHGTDDLAHLLPSRPGGVPDPLWAAIAELLDKDPRRRPTAAQAAERLGALSGDLAGWPVGPRLPEPPSPVDPRGRPAGRHRRMGALAAVVALGLWSPHPASVGSSASPPGPAAAAAHVPAP